jgi:hypothetical protein
MTQNTNRLLFNDPPLVVSPSLAVAVKSVDKAIILQQVHYWLLKSTNERDGRMWVYNSTKEWQEQFPFWTEKEIRTRIDNLRSDGYLLTANYNKLPMDRTLWYSIDYEKLSAICPNGQTICTPRANGFAPQGTAIPETTTETNKAVVVVVGRTLADVFRTWSQITKGTFNSIDSDKVKDLIDTHGADAVYQAMLDANEQGKRTLAYVNGILRNRQNGTEKPQPQQQRQGSGRRLSKVEESLAAVDRVMAMAERGELDEWLK